MSGYKMVALYASAAWCTLAVIHGGFGYLAFVGAGHVITLYVAWRFIGKRGAA